VAASQRWAGQVAVCAAAGINPFTLEDIEPIRVLILDLENSEPQLRRALRPLAIQAGDQLDPKNLLIEVRLEGLNLLSTADRAYLDRLVANHRPDLLITGPIYKMADGDPTEEKSAKPIASTIDLLRARYGCAVWIEAHSAKPREGQKRRPIEPYGASLWLRWPEFAMWRRQRVFRSRLWRGC
jgi:replicative DNA helicase